MEISKTESKIKSAVDWDKELSFLVETGEITFQSAARAIQRQAIKATLKVAAENGKLEFMECVNFPSFYQIDEESILKLINSPELKIS